MFNSVTLHNSYRERFWCDHYLKTRHYLTKLIAIIICHATYLSVNGLLPPGLPLLNLLPGPRSLTSQNGTSSSQRRLCQIRTITPLRSRTHDRLRDLAVRFIRRISVWDDILHGLVTRSVGRGFGEDGEAFAWGGRLHANCFLRALVLEGGGGYRVRARVFVCVTVEEVEWVGGESRTPSLSSIDQIWRVVLLCQCRSSWRDYLDYFPDKLVWHSLVVVFVVDFPWCPQSPPARQSHNRRTS